MATIVTRAGKGSPLTHNEVDANFVNLNNDKAETASPALTGTPTSTTAAVGTNTTQIATTAFVNAEIANDIAGKADLASPSFTGQVSLPDGTAAAPALTNTGDTNTGVLFPAADTVAVSTAGIERMRIESTGNVGIGTTTPGSPLDVTGIVTIGNYALNANLQLTRAEGTRTAPTQVTAAAILGTQTFYGLDNASAYREVAQIRAVSDGAITSTSSPGYLTFRTTPSGAVATTERLRIASAGQIGIGGANYGTSGQVLTSGGSGAAPSWGNLVDYQVFTASGTWTKPAGISANALVIVEIWAAGGGGGQYGGGGGGGYFEAIELASDLGSTVSVTVGAGGTYSGGTTGNAGGNSAFGSYTAYGGGGGLSSTAGGNGAGLYGNASGDIGVAAGSQSATIGSYATQIWGGAGGGADSTVATRRVGLNAIKGGGGGGGSVSGSDGTIIAGGTSVFGGNGGNGLSVGTAPAGGGGKRATGARGEVRVWTIG